MKILAIDTSCDETAAAVTQGMKILSNVIWSQASLHAEFGGVMPSLAQREHKERIDWVINKALKQAKINIKGIGAVAVTTGPGLAIALGVGIEKAREIAKENNLPLIPVNHVEGHLLSPMAYSNTSPPSPLPNKGERGINISYPAMGLVVSGGHTELILIKKIGEYKILAATTDDALGEALDKAARMLGLGYPGGAILEKMARLGFSKTYPLPLPLAGRENLNAYSYSGIKTALYRLTEELKKKNGNLSKQEIYDLAASFQNRAFEHLIRVSRKVLGNNEAHDLLVGGGVGANTELRKRLRGLVKELGMKIWFPYSKKLYGDNAGMIGVAASFHKGTINYRSVDRQPRARIDEVK